MCLWLVLLFPGLYPPKDWVDCGLTVLPFTLTLLPASPRPNFRLFVRTPLSSYGAIWQRGECQWRLVVARGLISHDLLDNSRRTTPFIHGSGTQQQHCHGANVCAQENEVLTPAQRVVCQPTSSASSSGGEWYADLIVINFKVLIKRAPYFRKPAISICSFYITYKSMIENEGFWEEIFFFLSLSLSLANGQSPSRCSLCGKI